MNEIQPLLVDQINEFLNSLATRAKVTINGVVHEKEVYQTSMKFGLRKYVKLSTEQGLISRAALVDSVGRELYVKELNYQKGQHGYVIAFPMQIEVKEVKSNV